MQQLAMYIRSYSCVHNDSFISIASYVITLLYITVDESVQNTGNAICFHSSSTCSGEPDTFDFTTNAGGNDCCDGTSQGQSHLSISTSACIACKLF